MGEPGDGWFPDQKLSAEEAIEFYTLGAAYAQFMEDRKGMIKEGYLADMVIYDRDFMTLPEEEIMQAPGGLHDCGWEGGFHQVEPERGWR